LQGAISAGVDFPALVYELFKDGSVEKKPEYKLGVKTRSIFPYEYRRLKTILRGNYSLDFKLQSLIGFLKFYQDDAYFIVSLDDVQPFLSMITRSVRRRIHF